MVAAGVALWALTDDVVGGIWLAFIGWFLAGAARSAEAQADFAGRIEHIRVADVMDDEPVAIPEERAAVGRRAAVLPALRLAVVPGGGLERQARGSRVAGGRGERARRGARRRGRSASVMARDDGSSGLRVRLDEPLENLLGQEGLSRLGAIMAVDGEGVLRGVVTIDAVRRALQGAVPA